MTTRARRLVRTAGMLGAILLVASCGDIFGPDRGPGIHFIRGANATGTPLQVLSEPLVVEVREPDGSVVREGTVIRFEPIIIHYGSYPTPTLAEANVASDDATFFATFTTREADKHGRASVRVQLGQFAREARIVVSAPVLGLLDTARFTVVPGPPSSIYLSPWDTTIVVGHSYTVHARVRDQFGNVRPDGVSWTVGGTGGGAGASITSAGVVTANAVGTFQFTARLIGSTGTPWAISSLTVQPPASRGR